MKPTKTAPAAADIPIAPSPPISRAALCARWEMDDRTMRRALARLRAEDPPDGLKIVAAPGGGYWRTDDADLLAGDYAKALARALGALPPPPKHLNRLRDLRARAMSREAFVEAMRARCAGFDLVSLSKAECGHLILAPDARRAAAEVLGAPPADIYPGLAEEYASLMKGGAGDGAAAHVFAQDYQLRLV